MGFRTKIVETVGVILQYLFFVPWGYAFLGLLFLVDHDLQVGRGTIRPDMQAWPGIRSWACGSCCACSYDAGGGSLLNRKLNVGLALLLIVAMFSWVALPAVRASGVTLYCWDLCYTTSTWTETDVGGGTEFNPSIASGSPPNSSMPSYLHVHNETYATTPYNAYFNSSRLADVPDGPKVLGFWVNVGAGSYSQVTAVLVRFLNRTTGAYFGVMIYYNNGVGQVWLRAQSSAYSIPGWGDVTLTVNTWYWVELDYGVTHPAYYALYVDGVLSSQEKAISGVVLDAGTEVQLWVGNQAGFKVGEVNFSYFRVASDLEPKGALTLPAWDPVSVTADLEGCGNWVFADARYYAFNSTWYNSVNATDLHTAKMRFQVPTPDGDVNATFVYVANTTSVAGGWNVTFSPQYADRSLVPCRTTSGSISYSADWHYAYVVFQVWFTTKCLDVYNQTYALDVDVWANNTAGAEVGWFTIAANYFRIYSRGGFTLTEETGLYSAAAGPGLGSGSVGGGAPLAVYARNNTYVFKDWVFRDLAHVKLLPEVSAKCGLQTFNIWYGVDVCMGGTDWQHALAFELTANSLTYQGPGGSGARNVNMTIRWYKRDSVGDLAYAGGMEDLLMFHRGDAAAPGEITWWRMWIDFWFDGSEGSTKIGGRLNAYEYAMEDGAQPWLKWLSTNWGPDQNATKESLFMTDILGADNVTVTSSTAIKLVRIWVKLEVVNAATEQYVVLTNYAVQDRTFSDPPLTGIQTPVFDETVVPVMPQAGFLGIVVSSFTWWGKWISDNIMWGGLSLWPAFVGFMDTIAAWLGYPNGFTYLLEYMSGGWTWFLSSLGWLYSALTSIFGFIGGWIAGFVFVFTSALATWSNMLSTAISFLYGGAGGLFDFVNGLALSTWVPVACVFYVVYLVILWDQEGMDAVMGQLTFLYHVGHLFVSWLLTISHFFLDLIGRIIESIPVVE